MDVLRIAALIGSGITAGVLFAVALSVVPGLFAMPADRYVYAHQLLGRNWDPTMPMIVLGSTMADVALAVLSDRSETMLFYGLAAGLLLVVSVVSHFCNVPLNRRVKSLDPDCMPADWSDPRPVWRRWHMLRTVVAVMALAVNASAAISA
ncbi:DUF1772 domain-containing protein [Nocardia salmonicida]|uniref:anthrone oxygenase family protein n=1 Tax=Nocardia salmonicida TaxID=53431 RepID=UPI003CEDEAD3